MSERRRCDTCIFWRRMTAKRGACSKVFTSQKRRLASTDRKKTTTAGWLMTRCDDRCASYQPVEVDVLDEDVSQEPKYRAPARSDWEREALEAKFERLKEIQHLGSEICAERLGLTLRQVRDMMLKLRVRQVATRRLSGSEWLPMDDILRQDYRNLSNKQLATLLTEKFGVEVSPNMVVGRAFRLGLKKKQRGRRYER